MLYLSSPEKEKQLRVSTSSAKRSKVSVLGSLIVRRSKKCRNARSPSSFGITVYRDLMSIVNNNLDSAGKLN